MVIEESYMGLPVFHFRQFSIFQHQAAMKVSTDSVLLGGWVNPENPSLILDIGSGTGLLALMMAQRFHHAHIVAVELEGGACADATLNFKASEWSDRLHLYCGDIKQWHNQRDARLKYDLIITNPPFFKNSLLSLNNEQRIARHQTQLELGELLKIASESLTPSGRLSLIFPADRLKEIVAAAAIYYLHLCRICHVYPKASKKANRVLLDFSLQSQPLYEESHIIRDENNTYSHEHLLLTADFYKGK